MKIVKNDSVINLQTGNKVVTMTIDKNSVKTEVELNVNDLVKIQQYLNDLLGNDY